MRIWGGAAAFFFFLDGAGGGGREGAPAVKNNQQVPTAEKQKGWGVHFCGAAGRRPPHARPRAFCARRGGLRL